MIGFKAERGVLPTKGTPAYQPALVDWRYAKKAVRFSKLEFGPNIAPVMIGDVYDANLNMVKLPKSENRASSLGKYDATYPASGMQSTDEFLRPFIEAHKAWLSVNAPLGHRFFSKNNAARWIKMGFDVLTPKYLEYMFPFIGNEEKHCIICRMPEVLTNILFTSPGRYMVTGFDLRSTPYTTNHTSPVMCGEPSITSPRAKLCVWTDDHQMSDELISKCEMYTETICRIGNVPTMVSVFHGNLEYGHFHYHLYGEGKYRLNNRPVTVLQMNVLHDITAYVRNSYFRAKEGHVLRHMSHAPLLFPVKTIYQEMGDFRYIYIWWSYIVGSSIVPTDVMDAIDHYAKGKVKATFFTVWNAIKDSAYLWWSSKEAYAFDKAMSEGKYIFKKSTYNMLVSESFSSGACTYLLELADIIVV
jgi:hypothetical protein